MFFGRGGLCVYDALTFESLGQERSFLVRRSQVCLQSLHIKFEYQGRGKVKVTGYTFS